MKDLYIWQSKFEPCYYSERLIKKIDLLNKRSRYKVDLNQIKKAIYYAKKYHSNQKRDSGEPFYTHPLAVAEMVAKYCFETNILVTSILHDTIEDTSLTKEALSHIFSENIAEQVDDLSRIKFNKKISVAESISALFEPRKESLLFIKLIDRLHNLQTIDFKSPEKQKTIILETAEYFMALAVYINNFDVENILLKTLTKKLHPKFDLLQFQYCHKTLDCNFQLSFLDLRNVIS